MILLCACFKLSKLNFREYCIFNTMHYLVYGNFDQVYACWEITNLVCKKMLEYCSEKTLTRKEYIIQFLALGQKKQKKENTQIRKKIIGKLC